jgi:hypothetical protein
MFQIVRDQGLDLGRLYEKLRRLGHRRSTNMDQVEDHVGRWPFGTDIPQVNIKE